MPRKTKASNWTSVLPPSIVEDCVNEGCDKETRYKMIIVDQHRISRLTECEVCGVRIKPIAFRVRTWFGTRNIQIIVFKLHAVSDLYMPGLMNLICPECASYCEDCRYNWEED